MGNRAALTQIPVEMAMVKHLDAMIASAPLGSYTDLINWVADTATKRGTPNAWAFAERREVHDAATRGDLVLIEVDESVRRLLDVVLSLAMGIVTYAPTYGTAIAWLLDVAELAGPSPLLGE